MANKTASVYARIDPKLKKEAESILSALGIPTSNAIDIFFKQIVLNRGLPFQVKLPDNTPLCLENTSKEELDAHLEQGYDDVLNGRVKTFAQVRESLEKDYQLWYIKLMYPNELKMI